MKDKLWNDIEYHLFNDIKPSIFLNEIKDELKGTNLEVLGQLNTVEQAPQYHPEGNVWNHVMLVIDIASKVKSFATNSNNFMIAALLHDIGKKATTRKNKQGRWISYDHDKVGAKIAYGLMIYYGFSEVQSQHISNLVLYHMHHIYILKDLPFSNVKNMLDSTELVDIILLFLSDKMGRGNGVENIDDIFLDLHKILEKLRIEYNVDVNDINDKLHLIKTNLLK